MHIVKYAKEVKKFRLEKKNQEIMAALQYKPQPQWKMGKKIQAAAYNGASTVVQSFFWYYKVLKDFIL